MPKASKKAKQEAALCKQKPKEERKCPADSDEAMKKEKRSSEEDG
jgi:hypothetical protein